MLSKGINKSHVWILILCLLIIITNVLVITGYIQIKYNKTLSLRNSNISNIEKDSILKENNELKSSIEKLEEELVRQKEEISQTEKKYKSAKDYSANILNVYEDLIKAEILRQNGDLIGSAEALKSVNKDYLQVEAGKVDNKIRNEVSKPAALYFYKAGQDDFVKGSYNIAIEEFKKSIYFITDEDFKDDCIFFLGKSYYLTGNNYVAKKTIKQLIDDFPDSEYKNEAENIYLSIN